MAVGIESEILDDFIRRVRESTGAAVEGFAAAILEKFAEQLDECRRLREESRNLNNMVKALEGQHDRHIQASTESLVLCQRLATEKAQLIKKLEEERDGSLNALTLVTELAGKIVLLERKLECRQRPKSNPKRKRSYDRNSSNHDGAARAIRQRRRPAGRRLA